MSRIGSKFARLKLSSRGGFIPFVTAGDPDIETSEALVIALAELGADVIELGVPFSDPMADGPVIQASSQRGLAAGTTLGRILEMVKRVRARTEVPIVLFSYFNPLFRYGVERLADEAAAAGVDGILITDVVDAESDEIRSIFDSRRLDLISLIAPTTTDHRLSDICHNARGFVYAVSRAGVTGASSSASDSAEELVLRARQFTELPIAVGFGVSTREHVEKVWRYADAAVVGSAIVSELEGSSDPSDAVERLRRFVGGLLPPFAKGLPEN